MARLFVAVWPSPAVVEALRSIERLEQPDVRFTTEDQWHVTLRFLGNVADDDVPAVAAALEAVGSCVAVDAVVHPRSRRLGRSAVVLDVDGLEPVADAVVEVVGRFGSEDRRFHGHLTLARVRGLGRRVPAGLGGLVESIRWPVRELTLVQSHLGRGPARYETLTTVRLRPAGE